MIELKIIIGAAIAVTIGMVYGYFQSSKLSKRKEELRLMEMQMVLQLDLREKKLMDLEQKLKSNYPMAMVRDGNPTFLRASYTGQRVFIIKGEKAIVKLQFQPDAMHVVVYRTVNDFKQMWIANHFQPITKEEFLSQLSDEKKRFEDVMQYLSTMNYV